MVDKIAHDHRAQQAGEDDRVKRIPADWPETTVVEPSSSWADPYLYLKILAEWKGVKFEAPALPGASK